MKHRVYMRDWYFNAGIVGFLRIVSDDAMPDDLADIDGLEIGDNYIEFDTVILKDYGEKFLRAAFIMLMDDMSVYLNKLQNIQKDIQKYIDNDKNTKEKTVEQICKAFTVSYEKFNSAVLGKLFVDEKSVDDLYKQIKNAIDYLKSTDTESVYDKLFKTKEGKDYINWFLGIKLEKAICSSANIEKYIDSFVAKKASENHKKASLKNKDYCLFCQERKAEHEFNNSVSNIIGFNKDNTNWIWGYQSINSRLCGLCALIYTSAFLGMVKIDKENKSTLFFINRNSDIKGLYKDALLFKRAITIDNKFKPFILLRDMILKVIEERARAVEENINFIEAEENQTLGGQSSKGYNIYNYNLSPQLAKFLKHQIGDLPKGVYKINDESRSIDDELVQKVINSRLGYGDLNFYISMYMRKSGFYSIYSVSKFIFDYINSIGSAGVTMDKDKVIKKAYANGKSLADRLRQNGRDNQIDSIVYGLLNDLKISDRENFLDKYIRLMMSHQMELKFGSNNEMADTDSFLQFGYSFINGLLTGRGNENDNIGSKGE